MDIEKYKKLYMQTVYDYFRKNAEWPTIRHVEKKILPTHRDFNVVEVMRSLVGSAYRGIVFSDPSSKAYLTLEQIRQCRGSEKDLEDIAEVISYCADKYIRSDEDRVEISSEGIRDHFQFDDLAVRRIGLLIGQIPILSQTSNNNDYSTWQIYITRDAISFDGIRSIDDYFDRLEKQRKSYEASRVTIHAGSNIIHTIEKIDQADPSDMKAIGVLALELSAGYYNEPLKQSRQSFLLMRIAAVVCLVLFFAAIAVLFLQKPANIAYINLLGGAISAFFSGIFFLMYRQASNQALSYKPQVDRAQNFIMANSACESLEGDTKHATRAELIKKLAEIQTIDHK